MSHRAVKKILKKVEKPLDKLHRLWYNKGVKGKEMSADRVMAYLRSVPKPQKRIKKYRKPLDNHHKLWYNTSVPKERNKKLGCDLPQEKELFNMANNIKVADKFDGVIALLNGEPTEMSVADAVAFITERKAMHTKKSAGERKPTAKQVENEGIKEKIVEALSASKLPMRVGDVMEAVGVDSNQRVTALLTQLIKANAIMRTEVKGVAYYGMPVAEG